MKRIATILLALIVLPSVASAESFTAKFAGTGFGATVSGKINGSAFDVWAGQIHWTSETLLDEFITYCVQFESHVTPTQVFDTKMPSHISSSEANQISYLVSTHFSSITSGAAAAGLQLAIWNVIYDNSDYSLLTGNFTSSLLPASLAATVYGNLFLADLAINAYQGGSATFLDARTGQDQVTRAVPEPATLLLFGLGAAAFALRRQRQIS